MSQNTIICWRSPLNPKRHVTVADYRTWEADGDSGRAMIADFFRQRLRERYVEPIEAIGNNQKNGFLIAAVCCLLMESLETFRQGWPSSRGREQLAFCSFIDRESRLHAFKGYAQQFYRHVRCGILHQGETTGGWRIVRTGPLFEKSRLRVNATVLHRSLSKIIDEFREELKEKSGTDEVWKKFKNKMNATIRNCEAQP